MENQVRPGYKSGSLTAKYPISGGKFWHCSCKCGSTTKASRWHLARRLRKTCGCRIKDKPDFVICTVCRQSKPRNAYYKRKWKTNHIHSSICKECFKTQMAEKCVVRHRRIRFEALVHYGGAHPQCACCGEQHLEFLHLDHANGDGNEHRRQMKAAGCGNVYSWLQRYDFPKTFKFRVLCGNCNFSLGAYGYCPHQRERQMPTCSKP